jgi:hypothetical protein
MHPLKAINTIDEYCFVLKNAVLKLFNSIDIFLSKSALIVFEIKGGIYLTVIDKWCSVVKWVSEYEYQREMVGYCGSKKC